MKRITVALGLALCAGCGDSNNAAQGPPVVTIAAERVLETRNFFGRTGDSLSITGSDNGESVLAWLPGNSDIVVQRFDSSLDEDGEAEHVTGVAPESLSEPSLCSWRGEFSMAWSGRAFSSSLPPGYYPDTGFVAARLDWNAAATLRVQDDLVGEETAVALACAADGSYALTWNHRCYAIDKRSELDVEIVYPEECDTQPSPGLYMQTFGSDGAPGGDPRRISDFDQGYVAAVAAADEDRFVILTPESIQLRDRSGELLDEVALGDTVYERNASIACVGTRCAAAFGSQTVQVWTFDVDDLAHPSVVVIRSRERTGPGEHEYGASPHVACSQRSACVVTWVLMLGVIVDEDFGYDESLAIYARGFDLDEGLMGDDVQIAAGEGFDDGALVASIGPRSFLTAWAGYSPITLQRLQLE